MDIVNTTNFEQYYDCSPKTKAKNFTPLMTLVLLTKRYPSLLQNIHQFANTINAVNSEGFTALHLAVRNSNTWSSTETVKALLTIANCNVNICNNLGCSPLHTAARYANLDSSTAVCKLLITYGANVNAIDNNKSTPLHYACRNSGRESNLAAVNLLLDNGACATKKNNFKESAISLACRYHNSDSTSETIKVLFKSIKMPRHASITHGSGFVMDYNECARALEKAKQIIQVIDPQMCSQMTQDCFRPSSSFYDIINGFGGVKKIHDTMGLNLEEFFVWHNMFFIFDYMKAMCAEGLACVIS